MKKYLEYNFFFKGHSILVDTIAAEQNAFAASTASSSFRPISSFSILISRHLTCSDIFQRRAAIPRNLPRSHHRPLPRVSISTRGESIYFWWTRTMTKSWTAPGKTSSPYSIVASANVCPLQIRRRDLKHTVTVHHRNSEKTQKLKVNRPKSRNKKSELRLRLSFFPKRITLFLIIPIYFWTLSTCCNRLLNSGIMWELLSSYAENKLVLRTIVQSKPRWRMELWNGMKRIRKSQPLNSQLIRW